MSEYFEDKTLVLLQNTDDPYIIWKYLLYRLNYADYVTKIENKKRDLGSKKKNWCKQKISVSHYFTVEPNELSKHGAHSSTLLSPCMGNTVSLLIQPLKPLMVYILFGVTCIVRSLSPGTIWIRELAFFRLKHLFSHPKPHYWPSLALNSLARKRTSKLILTAD